MTSERGMEAAASEREALLLLDKTIGRARFGVYAMLDSNEPLGEKLDAKLREAGDIVRKRLRQLDRRKD